MYRNPLKSLTGGSYTTHNTQPLPTASNTQYGYAIHNTQSMPSRRPIQYTIRIHSTQYAAVTTCWLPIDAQYAIRNTQPGPNSLFSTVHTRFLGVFQCTATIHSTQYTELVKTGVCKYTIGVCKYTSENTQCKPYYPPLETTAALSVTLAASHSQQWVAMRLASPLTMASLGAGFAQGRG